MSRDPFQEVHLDSGWQSVRARMQALAEVSPDLMLVTDRQGRIEYLNRALGQLPVESYVGTSVYGLLAESWAKVLETCIERVIATRKIDQCEVEYVTNESGARLIQVRVGPVLCSAEVVALAINGHDITDRRSEDPSVADRAIQEAEEQRHRHLEELAHAGRLSTMGQLVAAIAHEINQPLYAITNYAGACHNAMQPGSESLRAQLPQWIKEIETQARRAATIISKLGDFVRKSPSHRSTIDLNKLLISSLDLLRLEARSHQVRVGLELASPTPLVLCDRVQIEQIFVNLLRNAFDALEFVAPGDRRVAVKTERSGGYVRVHVEDCGKGISADEVRRLFEPFFTTKPHGMGMGLAISRSIIEAHGGRLWATRNVLAGITVHFELPAHADNLAQLASSADNSAPPA
jgi:PAS domain S-box-containing protein